MQGEPLYARCYINPQTGLAWTTYVDLRKHALLTHNMLPNANLSAGAQGGGAGGGSAGGEGGAGAGDKRPRGKGAGGKNGPGGHGKKPRPGGGNGGASGSGTRPEPKRKSYYIGEVRFSRPQSAWSQMMASGNRACFHCKAEGHVLAQCTNPVPGYPDVVRHGKK
ncbi:hypothetical protein Rsub_11703 [Raphidocelis subcapitata]|uniref:CCHC-type domain-containing protein n=1 Tax=Raphidocelis subcapitata TaxID=307507 RepID=A0A2V0PKG6_9CHLO|nr:hypothetical protein Rsub_11703 [Raphidocelis subcapitata]|eukprot:GBF98493.1 hypothetical protein Rsub_11703 [Raphidocelis subcapitata]